MTIPRFYPILDTAALEKARLSPEAAAAEILDAGARILQFRHKGHYSRLVFEQAERVAAQCRQAGALFVVNDRIDIAMLLDAGAHVGQDDLPPGHARCLLGPGRLLGFSTHNEDQLRRAAEEPADYLAIGPIFATGSKANPDPVLGIQELRRLSPLSASRPLVAIGGITLETAPDVIEAGASAVAVIGDLYTAGNIGRRARQWVEALGAV